jgi:hypothetical protein
MALACGSKVLFIPCCRYFAQPGEIPATKDGIYHSAEGQKVPTA